VAATEELVVQKVDQQKADALAAWIAKHGSSPLRLLHVDALETGSGVPVPRVVLSLPWQHLSQLRFLAAKGLSMGVSSRLPATLVYLQLKDCDAVTFGCGMSHLAALTALKRLELRAAFSDAYAALGGEAAYSAALSSTIGQLQQLTALELEAWPKQALPGYAVAGVSNLTRLRDLKLAGFGTAAQPVSLQDLPSNVAELRLGSTATAVMEELGNSSSSSSDPLPALQLLSLCSSVMFQLSAIARFSQLQGLSCAAGQIVGTPGLLAVLPRLQQLQFLKLECFDDAVDAAEYAAITSSSRLVSLRLVCCSIPQAALQHMFAPGRRLPHLRCLDVSVGGCEPTKPSW
jgi:hypothetical protein